jgi:hypothetical protein
MRFRQTRVLITCRGTQGFLDDNSDLLAAVNRSGARRTLDNVVAQLSEHAVTQEVGTRMSKGETANQKALRVVLRFHHMKPIAEVARMRLRDVPNFIALKLPPSGSRGAALIAAAGGMADAAAPYVATFIDAGLEEDFLEQLRQAADAVRRSLDDRAQSVRKRAGATQGLRVEEKRGTGILRLLDALVIPKLGTNDRLIAEWKAARKIHAKPGPLVGSRSAPAASDIGVVTHALTSPRNDVVAAATTVFETESDQQNEPSAQSDNALPMTLPTAIHTRPLVYSSRHTSSGGQHAEASHSRDYRRPGTYGVCSTDADRVRWRRGPRRNSGQRPHPA